MFGYYLALGVRHLRRNPVLTGLMVVTLAVGVAAAMSTLTVLRAMSLDPIPQKSDRLFVPLVDNRPADEGPYDADEEPPEQLTYPDAVALHATDSPAQRSSAVMRVSPVVTPARADDKPFFGDGIAVHGDFFAMMDIPFIDGAAWKPQDDERAGRVVVLRAAMADRLFPDGGAVGKTLRLGTDDYVVTGVVSNEWEPLPRFYRVVSGPPPFIGQEDLFIPWPTAIAKEMDPQGNVNCFKDPPPDAPKGYEGLKQSECIWIQFWVELASADQADEYRDFLAGYVAEQRKLGRFPRATNNRLYDVPSWLEINRVVSRDSRLQTYLAFGFLLVCLVNVIGLLLAKFTARSGEIGVRRALGARRRAVFQQYLIEAGVIGLAGGLVGLALTFGSLKLIARQSDELALLARMDWLMLAVTLALAVLASLLAGLLPTWRACQVQPALQLKSQ
ncbi:MAG TPA: ABC transporter permease [Kofleriaceae bacterium]|nr:ABC transporter permease [Kofleriaceae bacterium]